MNELPVSNLVCDCKDGSYKFSILIIAEKYYTMCLACGAILELDTEKIKKEYESAIKEFKENNLKVGGVQ